MWCEFTQHYIPDLCWVTHTFKYPEYSEKVKNNNMEQGSVAPFKPQWDVWIYPLEAQAHATQDGKSQTLTVHGQMV